MLGFWLSNESLMISEPVRLLLTKKMAPPPSLAVLPVIFTPHRLSVNVLPSR